MTKRALWILFLSVYLVLVGLVQLFALTFTGLPIILGVCALVAGIALFLGK